MVQNQNARIARERAQRGADVYVGIDPRVGGRRLIATSRRWCGPVKSSSMSTAVLCNRLAKVSTDKLLSCSAKPSWVGTAQTYLLLDRWRTRLHWAAWGPRAPATRPLSLFRRRRASASLALLAVVVARWGSASRTPIADRLSLHQQHPHRLRRPAITPSGSPAFVFGQAEPDSQAEEGCLRRRPGRPSRCKEGAIAAPPHEAIEHGWSRYTIQGATLPDQGGEGTSRLLRHLDPAAPRPTPSTQESRAWRGDRLPRRPGGRSSRGSAGKPPIAQGGGGARRPHTGGLKRFGEDVGKKRSRHDAPGRAASAFAGRGERRAGGRRARR